MDISTAKGASESRNYFEATWLRLFPSHLFSFATHRLVGFNECVIPTVTLADLSVELGLFTLEYLLVEGRDELEKRGLLLVK